MTPQSNYYPVDKLDARQRDLPSHFADSMIMDTVEKVARVVDWITFYRRNVEYFVTHYFGLHLFPYQRIMLHEMGAYGNADIVAARASGKTFVTAIYACAYAVLYPGSLIVISSSTKEQAGILVKEKIQGELMRDSATLRGEIESISVGKNDTRVRYKNGSIIIVVVAGEGARGHRAHLLILDEYRLIKKETVDEILAPFLINHTYPFHKFEEYKDVTVPTGTVQISSSWYCSHWMWDKMKMDLSTYLDGGNQFFMCLDYTVCLRHGIKSRETLYQQYRALDLMSWQIEYENRMVMESTKAFYTFDMINACRTLKRQFYPRKNEDVLRGAKNKFQIPKQEGEVRIVAADIAFVNRAGNDNSCFSCLRLIPENVSDNGTVHQGYKRQLVYLEAFPGKDTGQQALRIKQLFRDFDGDYLVLDCRNAGRLCPLTWKRVSRNAEKIWNAETQIRPEDSV